METLETKLRQVVEGVEGTFGWVVEDPETGDTSRHLADTVFPAASTPKLAVFVHLLAMVDAHRVRLSDTIRLRRWHQVGGAGVLQYFAPGCAMTLIDVAQLMVILSDNTATNMVLDVTGFHGVNAIAPGGAHLRRYYGKPRMPVPDGLAYTALATPEGLASIYRRVLSGSLLTAPTQELFWRTLSRQQDRSMMPRFLEDTIDVAHKTGAIEGIRHDAGVFWIPKEKPERRDVMAIQTRAQPPGRPIIFVAMARNLGDQRWSVENEGEATIGRLARCAFAWFAERQQKTTRD